MKLNTSFRKKTVNLAKPISILLLILGVISIAETSFSIPSWGAGLVQSKAAGSTSTLNQDQLFRFNRFIVSISPLDEKKSPDSRYLYQCWNGSKLNQVPKRQPDLQLRDGRRVPDGTGGNYYYTFENPPFEYRCYVTVIGTEDSPPAWIEVYRNATLVSRFDAHQ